MKKTYCACAAIGLVFMAASAFAQMNIDTLNDFKKGTYARLGMVATSLNYVWMNQMDAFLKRQDFDGYFGLVQTIPFEAGFRFKDWFLNTKVELPIFISSYNEQRFFLAELALEKSFAQNRNFRFNAGLGGGFYSYHLELKQNEDDLEVDFGNLFNTRYGSVPGLYNSGGALDVYLAFTHKEKRKVSVAHYVRAGYRRGFRAYPWKADYFNLSNAPADRLDIFYLQMLISLSRN